MDLAERFFRSIHRPSPDKSSPLVPHSHFISEAEVKQIRDAFSTRDLVTVIRNPDGSVIATTKKL